MSFNRRMGEARPKRRTLPAKDPERHDHRIVVGDVVALYPNKWGRHTIVGIVVRPDRGWGKAFEMVDTEGQSHHIGKIAPDPAFADDPDVIFVGHDDEWLSFEQEAIRRRHAFDMGHRRAAFKEVNDTLRRILGRVAAAKDKDRGEVSCEGCSHLLEGDCRIGEKRETCTHKRPFRAGGNN